MQLHEYREKTGKTQSEIAEVLGCAVSTVCRYETGTRLPSLRVIRKIKAMTDGQVAEDDWACEVAANG